MSRSAPPRLFTNVVQSDFTDRFERPSGRFMRFAVVLLIVSVFCAISSRQQWTRIETGGATSTIGSVAVRNDIQFGGIIITH